jgi:hypothetical protein
MATEERLPLLEDSIEATLKNVITKAEFFDLRTDKPEEFENSLIREIRFLALYDREELTKVEKYIHEHAPALYQFALDHAA